MVDTRKERGNVTFVMLVWHNVGVRKLRLALTTLAVAIGVVTVVSLGVVTHSLESSDLAILATGRADFTVAQKGVSDIVSSNIDEAQLTRIAGYRGVDGVTGVLIGTTPLNSANPQFLEIGIRPDQLAAFGVSVVDGRPFTASASDEVMLGWRAAENVGAHVGDRIELNQNTYLVAGIYSTGQALGDAGAMLPLAWFQTLQRQPSGLTLVFVRAAPGTDIAALQRRIDRDNPQLTTIRTIAQFGRADRSLALIRAANQGSTVLAIVIGAVVVMSAMTMTFIERLREFGILSAIGWPRRRVMAMILSEALVIGLLGAVVGLALAVVAIGGVQQLPSLAGVLHPDYTPGVFGRALYTAAVMTFLGGMYPAGRAALTTPIVALRHE
jgi:putative ABC transport system permease protein